MPEPQSREYAFALSVPVEPHHMDILVMEREDGMIRMVSEINMIGRVLCFCMLFITGSSPHLSSHTLALFPRHAMSRTLCSVSAPGRPHVLTACLFEPANPMTTACGSLYAFGKGIVPLLHQWESGRTVPLQPNPTTTPSASRACS